MSAALPPDPAILRRRAADLAYGLGCALWLHPDGRIRIAPEDEDTEWMRVDPAPGAAPATHGHTNRAEAAP